MGCGGEELVGGPPEAPVVSEVQADSSLQALPCVSTDRRLPRATRDRRLGRSWRFLPPTRPPLRRYGQRPLFSVNTSRGAGTPSCPYTLCVASFNVSNGTELVWALKYKFNCRIRERSSRDGSQRPQCTLGKSMTWFF